MTDTREIETLISQRSMARALGDAGLLAHAEAMLAERNVALVDGPKGTTWSVPKLPAPVLQPSDYQVGDTVTYISGFKSFSRAVITAIRGDVADLKDCSAGYEIKREPLSRLGPPSR